MLERGHEVISSDLVARGFGEARIDFLMETFPRAPNIVTNPPYKLRRPVRSPCGNAATSKVAFLMRLVWLAGQRRRKMFARAPLARVWVSQRKNPSYASA